MIKIRKMKPEDIQLLADIWLKASLKAHHFISEEYWINNKSLMAENYLPNSEVYIAEKMDKILGFVALIENHIASIFVDNEQQGKGIGSLLLEYTKELRTNLTLSVYQKNEKSVTFYKSKKFIILSETIDEPTGEKEFTMEWNKTIK